MRVRWASMCAASADTDADADAGVKSLEVECFVCHWLLGKLSEIFGKSSNRL